MRARRHRRSPCAATQRARHRLRYTSSLIRRLHVQHLAIGRLPLGAADARHARTVLRLREGSVVELFDSSGATADGTLVRVDEECVWVEVLAVRPVADRPRIVIASAVPKGDRADWLVEKLSELGVTEWIPLVTARSVVHPAGNSKTARWARLATESAKQCKRPGVMSIAPLTAVADALSVTNGNGIFLSTGDGNSSLIDMPVACNTICFIGPEGGWTTDEESHFKAAGLHSARLTSTVLRIETATLATAAVVSMRLIRL